jgi:hypothetical protein
MITGMVLVRSLLLLCCCRFALAAAASLLLLLLLLLLLICHNCSRVRLLYDSAASNPSAAYDCWTPSTVTI